MKINLSKVCIILKQTVCHNILPCIQLVYSSIFRLFYGMLILVLMQPRKCNLNALMAEFEICCTSIISSYGHFSLVGDCYKVCCVCLYSSGDLVHSDCELPEFLIENREFEDLFLLHVAPNLCGRKYS